MERRIQCFIQEYDTLLICYLLMNSFLKFNTTLNATLNSTNLGTLSIFSFASDYSTIATAAECLI